MKIIAAVTLSLALILSGCSKQSAEGEDLEQADKLDHFERKNIAPNPADNQQTMVSTENSFARIALDCINRQYPNKISHVLSSAADVAEPNKLTPVFYGCYDWHSSVHGHWLLTRLWGEDLVPEMDDEISAALNSSFTDEKIAGEIAYFKGEDRAGFERPYGLAWFLQLTAELREIAKGNGEKAAMAQMWLTKLMPLESVIVTNIKAWLPKLAYPIRLGTHNQSAFAFGLFLDWAAISGDTELADLVRKRSLEFHQNDKNCPLAYEPSGEDFLSPCLMEADLMRRVMDQAAYGPWLADFLPSIPIDGSDEWLKLGIVNDPSDGKLVHLDGLNLSRAWALEGIASALPADDQRRLSLLAAAKLHGESGQKSVSTPHYSGSHWLASFATYWKTRRGINPVTGEDAPPEATDTAEKL